jgi:hypothetical protein
MEVGGFEECLPLILVSQIAQNGGQLAIILFIEVLYWTASWPLKNAALYCTEVKYFQNSHCWVVMALWNDLIALPRQLSGYKTAIERVL